MSRPRLTFCGIFFAAVTVAALAQPSSERAAATERDYRATLTRLGISSMRPGADGRDRNAPNAANYSEDKVGPVPPLPPLLTTSAGKQVTSPLDWWRVRRPELLALFDREMYGRVPASAPPIRWDEVEREQRRKGTAPVITRKFVGRDATGASDALRMDLTVTLPAAAAGKIPLVLELGFPEGSRFPGFAGPRPTGPDWTEQVVARGWGYAILVPSTVQPDDGAGLASGVIGLASSGRPRAPDEWGALRAWAWGASRALDLLQSDPQIDGRHVAIEGLSRYGKSASVAMAYDRRFSMAFIG